MGHLRLLLVLGMAIGMTAAYGAELAPVCGAAEAPAERGCWQPLENRRDCHVWIPGADNEAFEEIFRGDITFEGVGCRDGKLSGTVTVRRDWVARRRSAAATGMGPYAEGKRQGDWHLVRHHVDSRLDRWDIVDEFHNSGAYEDGVRQGRWVEVRHGARVSNYDPRNGDVAAAAHERTHDEGTYVDGRL